MNTLGWFWVGMAGAAMVAAWKNRIGLSYRFLAAWRAFTGRGVEYQLMKHRVGEGARFDLRLTITPNESEEMCACRTWTNIDAHNIVARLISRTAAGQTVSVHSAVSADRQPTA